MTVIDLVRAAIEELGDGAPVAEVSRFIAGRYEALVDARFVPVYLSTLRAEQLRQEARERAARIIEGDRRVRNRSGRGPTQSPCTEPGQGKPCERSVPASNPCQPV